MAGAGPGKARRICIYDLVRANSSRFTNDPNDESTPVWVGWAHDPVPVDRGTGSDAAPDFFTKGLDGAAE